MLVGTPPVQPTEIAAIAQLVLPPGFRARNCAEPWAEAARAGEAGEAPGAVFWAEASGHCRMAVLLHPERAIGQASLLDLGLLALFDALAMLAPPQVPLDVAPPARLRLDGGLVGSVAGNVTPGWAVLGLDVAMRADSADPGERPDETCLAEEGLGDVTGSELIAQSCRYLLNWIDVWRHEGAASLARAVDQRLPRRAA